MQKSKKHKGILSIISWNIVITILLVSIMALFHYFSLMDVHLLSIMKTIFTKKPFTLETILLMYGVILCIATICVIPFYLYFPQAYPLLAEVVFALFLTFIYLYLIPLLFVSVQIASYNIQSIVHIFCMFLIYSICLGETIRIRYMI